MNNKLKPCPFCGCEPEWKEDVKGGWWKIHCVECSEWMTVETSINMDRDKLIKLWNRRINNEVSKM